MLNHAHTVLGYHGLYGRQYLNKSKEKCHNDEHPDYVLRVPNLDNIAGTAMASPILKKKNSELQSFNPT